MRTIANNNTNVNNTVANNTTAAASSRRRQSSPAPANEVSGVPTATFVTLTKEQQDMGMNLMFIMERVTNREGVKWLELDKKSDPDNVIIKAVESLDDKVRKQATWAISISARAIGGKYDKDKFLYTFPRKEFSAVVGYYKLAKAAGMTTIKADDKTQPADQKPQTSKPATVSSGSPAGTSGTKPKPTEQKPQPTKPSDKNLITKADALARCKKALAIALTKDMIACMEDELKAIFA